MITFDLAAASVRDLNQRLPISGDEEIAALGNALNTMAKNLGAQVQELAEGKQRLESIVGAMTEGIMVLDGPSMTTTPSGRKPAPTPARRWPGAAWPCRSCRCRPWT